MSSKPTRVAVAILLAGVVGVAAGCGGGSKTNTNTLHSLLKAGTTSQPKTTSSGAEPTFASASNCQELAGLAAKAAASVQSSGTANAVQTEVNELQALAKAAPSDIRGDFQTFADAFTGFIHTIQASGYKLGSKKPPTPAQAASLAKAVKSFDTTKLKQAEHHLEAWSKQNCKGIHVGG